MSSDAENGATDSTATLVDIADNIIDIVARVDHMADDLRLLANVAIVWLVVLALSILGVFILVVTSSP